MRFIHSAHERKVTLLAFQIPMREKLARRATHCTKVDHAVARCQWFVLLLVHFRSLLFGVHEQYDFPTSFFVETFFAQLPLTQCIALPYSHGVRCRNHSANQCPQGGVCQCACTSSAFFPARCACCCLHCATCKCILPLVLCPGKLDFASLSRGSWLDHLK